MVIIVLEWINLGINVPQSSGKLSSALDINAAVNPDAPPAANQNRDNYAPWMPYSALSCFHTIHFMFTSPQTILPVALSKVPLGECLPRNMLFLGAEPQL